MPWIVPPSKNRNPVLAIMDAKPAPRASKEPAGKQTAARAALATAERKAANLAGLLVPSRSLHRGVMGGGTRAAVPKKQRRSDTSREALIHKGRLAALGCMVCRRLYGPHEPGPVELHHLRKDGWGRGDYRTLMPLCPDHHRGPLGVHGLGTKGFPRHYGFDQTDLLADALALLEKTP